MDEVIPFSNDPQYRRSHDKSPRCESYLHGTP